MDFNAIRWVIEQKLPCTEKMILVALADFHNDKTGQCNPEKGSIASKAGLCVRSSATGEVDTTCPECSHTRKKKTQPCLSVNVDQQTWFCHRGIATSMGSYTQLTDINGFNPI